MFNRYWRTYPWGMQVLLLILTIFTLASFVTYLLLLLMPKFTGLSFGDLTNLSATSTPRTLRAGLWLQAISHAGMFAIPGLLFATFAHPRVREYLGLRAPGKSIHWLLVTGLMLGLIPVFLWGEAWTMQHMHLGKWAADLQMAGDKIIGAFLHLNSGFDLVLLLGVLALLPAIGEEIIFRGILLRLVHRRVTRRLLAETDEEAPLPDAQQSMLFPVIFTALLFSTIHFNPYGFVFIFIAGCVLAQIYFLTGSLLCSMWAHLLYNGLQVMTIFFSQQDIAKQKIEQGENLPAIYPLAGLALFVICFYFLVKNQTPLSIDWSDDFKGETPTSQPTGGVPHI